MFHGCVFLSNNHLFFIHKCPTYQVANRRDFMKRAALYLRVSTDKQTVKNQEIQLRQVAERRGWEVVEVYDDAGISGAKGRKDRPGLDRMLNDASRRKF